eukprot:486140_1
MTHRNKRIDSIIIIEKGEPISHYIQPVLLTDEEMIIKLSLHESVKKTTRYYIYECGNEEGYCLGKLTVKKNKKHTDNDIDIDEIENESFKVALYQQQHDTKPISNVLELTKPDENWYEVDNDYAPNPILLSTVKAIEVDDEKNENIYVYFDMPLNLKGEDIEFKISYISDDHKESELESISLPLIISKSSIPKSFTITTCIEINDEEYLSKPSDIITIDYEKPISFMVDYIYNDHGAMQIDFNKSICTNVNVLKQIIINELKIDNTNSNALKIRYKGNDKQLREINQKNFNSLLSSTEKHVITLYVGFYPDTPIIIDINKKEDGQFSFKLLATQCRKTTCFFDIKSQKKEDCDKLDRNNMWTKNLIMVINGINPYGKYQVRVKAINPFGESQWSEWTPWLQQKKEIEKYKLRVAYLENEKDQYEAKLKKQQKELNDRKNKLSMTQKTNQTQKQQIQQLQKEALTTKKQMEIIGNKYKQLKEKAKIKINSLQNTIKEQAATNDQLAQNVKQIRHECKAYKQQNKDLNKQCENFKNQLLNYKEMSKTLKEECNNIKFLIKNEKQQLETQTTQTIIKFKQRLLQEDKFKEQLENKTKMIENESLIVELHNRLVAAASATDLSSPCPFVEDIIFKYDMIKTQLHTQSAKLIRRILKKQSNDYTNMKNAKIANHLLFDILIASYTKIQKYESKCDINDK